MSAPLLKRSMVAFIDVLGMRDRALSVSSEEDLVRLCGEIKAIHCIFDRTPSHRYVPQANRAVGKRVLAFSDAIIVVMDLDSDVSRIIGILDTMADELTGLAQSQALAVVNGTFVRGGIAGGYCWNEGDVLVSDALVRAYAMETCTCFPVISIEDQFYKSFVTHPGNECYCKGDAPRDTLFSSFKKPDSEEAVHFLDYLRIAIHSSTDWHCDEDRSAYVAERDPQDKARIMSDSFSRSQLRLIEAHAEAVRVELGKNHRETVRRKYEWLRDYHDRTVEQLGFPATQKVWPARGQQRDPDLA